MAAVTRTSVRSSFVRPTFLIAALRGVAFIGGCAEEPAHVSDAPPNRARLQRIDGEYESDPSAATADTVVGSLPSAACAASDPSIDWSEATVLAHARGQRAQTLRAYQGDLSLHLCVEGELPADQHYQLFFDSDGDPTTGESEGGWAPNGTELRIEDGNLYKLENDAWSAAEPGILLSTQRDAHTLSVVISNTGAQLAPHFAVGFRQSIGDWNDTMSERLPTSGHDLARLP